VKRPSLTDLATLLVASLAIVIALQPTSAIRQSISRWMQAHRQNTAIASRWPEIEQTAVKLYDSSDPPLVVEVLDYQCPFCRQTSPSVDSAVVAGARIAVIHLPIRSHELAVPAALAALCTKSAAELREATALIFSAGGRLDSLRSHLARTDKIRSQQWEFCMQDSTTRANLGRHVALTESLFVSATPTFLTRSGRFVDRPSASALTSLSEKAGRGEY
jgi:protein-disulfide isomerase